jgi:hypothetical protein
MFTKWHPQMNTTSQLVSRLWGRQSRRHVVELLLTSDQLVAKACTDTGQHNILSVPKTYTHFECL